MLIKYPRGAVYWLRNNAPKVGSIQEGQRPCVIVSNTMNNIHSPVVTIVPITSQTKNHLPVHVEIPAVKEPVGTNIILCEQVTTVSKTQLEDFYGVLDNKTMQKVDMALSIQLNLIELVKTINPEPTPEPPTIPKTPNTIMKDDRGYSDEFKKQFLEDAKKMPNNKLAKKYGITAKASSARKSSWTRYFENKSK